jgi:drug/metabolite transporter (DMT)-like permease
VNCGRTRGVALRVHAACHPGHCRECGSPALYFPHPMQSRGPYPELVVAIASAAWGLFWIPLRAFERQGLQPASATLAQFVAPLAVLVPFALARGRRGQPTGVQRLLPGLLVGGAVALYLESLLLTDVARALILFYAMPAWGTVLEVTLMHRRLTRWRLLSILLSVAGLLTILGISNRFMQSVNLGDLMALLSGILFAFGAMQVRQAPEASVFEQLFAFFLYGSVIALALSMLPLAALGHAPAPPRLMALLPWLLLTAIGFLIPVMSGIYWGSQHVDPGRLGILLQIEAVVGIVSAALFAGEPFGVQQATGGALVIAAGVVEVLGNNQAQPAPASG